MQTLTMLLNPQPRFKFMVAFVLQYQLSLCFNGNAQSTMTIMNGWWAMYSRYKLEVFHLSLVPST